MRRSQVVKALVNLLFNCVHIKLVPFSHHLKSHLHRISNNTWSRISVSLSLKFPPNELSIVEICCSFTISPENPESLGAFDLSNFIPSLSFNGLCSPWICFYHAISSSLDKRVHSHSEAEVVLFLLYPFKDFIQGVVLKLIYKFLARIR